MGNLYSFDFKNKEELRTNELYKNVNDQGVIEICFISQDSRTRTSFSTAAEYLNELLDDGYKVVNTEEDTIGDYATYRDDHKYVVFEDGRFRVGSSPMGDCPHYDHEWIKYSLAKEDENTKKEYNSGDEVNLILWDRDDKFALRIEKKIVKENFGGYITFEGLDRKYELNDIVRDVDVVFGGYSTHGFIWNTILSPNEEYTKDFIARFEEEKNKQMEKRIKYLKAELEETQNQLKTKIKIVS